MAMRYGNQSKSTEEIITRLHWSFKTACMHVLLCNVCFSLETFFVLIPMRGRRKPVSTNYFIFIQRRLCRSLVINSPHFKTDQQSNKTLKALTKRELYVWPSFAVHEHMCAFATKFKERLDRKFANHVGYII